MWSKTLKMWVAKPNQLWSGSVCGSVSVNKPAHGHQTSFLLLKNWCQVKRKSQGCVLYSKVGSFRSLFLFPLNLSGQLYLCYGFNWKKVLISIATSFLNYSLPPLQETWHFSASRYCGWAEREDNTCWACNSHNLLEQIWGVHARCCVSAGTPASNFIITKGVASGFDQWLELWGVHIHPTGATGIFTMRAKVHSCLSHTYSNCRYNTPALI